MSLTRSFALHAFCPSGRTGPIAPTTAPVSPFPTSILCPFPHYGIYTPQPLPPSTPPASRLGLAAMWLPPVHSRW